MVLSASVSLYRRRSVFSRTITRVKLSPLRTPLSPLSFRQVSPVDRFPLCACCWSESDFAALVLICVAVHRQIVSNMGHYEGWLVWLAFSASAVLRGTAGRSKDRTVCASRIDALLFPRLPYEQLDSAAA